MVMIDPWSVPSEASFEEKWASEIPAATDAGTYYVWYKVVGDDNHNDTEPVCVSVKIDKANATAATVTANNRAYDGTEQPLVTVSGEPTGGEMQYAIGTATEATQPYTTSIPTATEAGTYYVWYKVVGDTNHTDTAAECAVTVIVPVFGPATFTLPASTKSVGESAFEGLPMTIVEIPSGCTSIGAKAFKDCANLTQIRIPASVTSIDTTAFEGCEKVLVYGTADSAAQTFCADHANCTFVAEN